MTVARWDSVPADTESRIRSQDNQPNLADRRLAGPAERWARKPQVSQVVLVVLTPYQRAHAIRTPFVTLNVAGVQNAALLRYQHW